MDQDFLKTLLSYEEATGAFRWKAHRMSSLIGMIAGHKHKRGYVIISIQDKKYYAHRLAWFYVHGFWAREIDHINRDRSDNRIVNLRDVDHATNMANQSMRSDNKSGFRGIFVIKKTGKWAAHTTVRGKRRYIGYFDTPEKAGQAYLDFHATLHRAAQGV